MADLLKIKDENMCLLRSHYIKCNFEKRIIIGLFTVLYYYSLNVWTDSFQFSETKISNSVIQNLEIQELDAFGYSVAYAEDIAVIGAYLHDSNGIEDVGTVFVFSKRNDTWILSAELIASDAQTKDWFGYSVSISMDTIVVGAFREDVIGANSGSVYLYEKPANGWLGVLTENAKLTASDAAKGDQFGYAVSVDADIVVVGAPYEDDLDHSSGSAYMFIKPASGWTNMRETSKLTSSGASYEDKFGITVSVHNETIVVGAIHDDGIEENCGLAYVFTKPSGGWMNMTETATLLASDASANDNFGCSISISKDVIVVGVKHDNDGSGVRNTGSAYVFSKPENGWSGNITQNAKLTASDADIDDKFGSAVTINNDSIVIGSCYDDDRGPDSGSVYLFNKPHTGWIDMTETNKLIPSAVASYDYFGHSVSIEGNTVLVGSWGNDEDGNNAGTAYLFDQSTTLNVNTNISLCPTNLNVYRNQDIEIAVDISDASGVIGYRVALDLDPNKVTYVPGSANKAGTLTETGWGPIVVNSASPELAIFACASASGTITSGSGSLMKFQLHVNDTLADFTPISVTFNPLTSLNEDAIAYSAEIWSATVIGPNHQPSFTGGPNQVVLEDSGSHTINNWATNIVVGPAYESWQSAYFNVDVSNPSLFSASPTIDASGILRFTSDVNEYGISDVTAILQDTGGTANGGIDSSTPYLFTIIIDPVNDRPSFIAGATPVVLNATGGQHEFINWATGIIVGPLNESSQSHWFWVDCDQPELFSATPAINAAGTLTFTPSVGAHGVVNATAFMIDSGGTANGGIDWSTPQYFVTKIYIPFVWGDLNANDQAGSVDASYLLQFDAALIDRFPGYPVNEYPEYYPDPSRPWDFFPLAADVDADDYAGTVDASLVLQKYAFLIDYFPADTNNDDWGPDAPLPPGKLNIRSVARTMSVSIEPDGNSWIVKFSVDNADEISGIRLVLLYDPEQAAVDEQATSWLVSSGMLVTNNTEPGKFIIAGALMIPLGEGESDLISVKFDRIGNAYSNLVQIDQNMTQINDGQIQLSSESALDFEMINPTHVSEWMIY